MGLIPAGALPHVKRFGWSGALALIVARAWLNFGSTPVWSCTAWPTSCAIT